ncbi:MAG: tyrosine-type recombinase/integrase [Bacteroidales bacterium]|nr:tyrosine-type recombinase/integrase [Bacteroidales bacterium]
MKKVIHINRVQHKGADRIKLVFNYDEGLIERVRKLSGARWSQTMGCWHIPYRKDYITYLTGQLPEIYFINEKQKNSGIKVEKNIEGFSGIIEVYHSKKESLYYFKTPYFLRDEILKLEKPWWHPGAKCWSVYATPQNLEQLRKIMHDVGYDIQVITKEIRKRAIVHRHRPSPPDLADKRFEQGMILRKLSPKTITTYKSFVNRFLYAFRNKDIETLPSEAIREYLFKSIEDKRYSRSFQNQMINAIKKYYELVYERELTDMDLPRPEKSRSLPNVISKEDVQKMINVTHNLKHKAIISIIYGCGLRRQEVVELKLKDIDFNARTMVIHGKGDKYRIVPIGKKLLKLIQEYIKSYLPEEYLFNGPQGRRYSASSIGKLVRQKGIEAKINKPVKPHTLRHSFATHLLDSGVDIRIIQELLGHSSIKTTEIYTHVSRKNIMGINGPFEKLN